MIQHILRFILLSFLINLSTQTVNCTDGRVVCGSGITAVCCLSSDLCNVNRGIPACENKQQPIISGFSGAPCVDPYLNDCSSFLGISGFCCPIGTVCFNDGLDQVVSCINAYGATSAALPSATQGFTPSATIIPSNNGSVIVSPPGAWNNSNSSPSCSPSRQENQNAALQTTSAINATVSFNYTGPSIMINTVTSSQGGVFAVIVDGFNTTDVIDTFSGPGAQLPQCYHVEYPPFLKPPPTLSTQNDHSIQLLYTGPSPNAPGDATENSGQFDSFGIPSFPAVESTQSSNSMGMSTPAFFVSVLIVTAIFCTVL